MDFTSKSFKYISPAIAHNYFNILYYKFCITVFDIHTYTCTCIRDFGRVSESKVLTSNTKNFTVFLMRNLIGIL